MIVLWDDFTIFDYETNIIRIVNFNVSSRRVCRKFDQLFEFRRR